MSMRRYNPEIKGGVAVAMNPSDDGDWVRWVDVEVLFDAAQNLYNMACTGHINPDGWGRLVNALATAATAREEG